MNIAINMLDKITASITNISEERERLRKELSKTDTAISDILHELEITVFNAATGYKFAKMLKTLRQQRRSIKNYLEEIQMLTEYFKDFDLIKIRKRLLKTQHQQQHRKYTARIVTPAYQQDLLKIV